MAETNASTTRNVPIITVDQIINSIENLYFACLGVVILLLVSSLPLSKLCIGVIYLNQCPIQQQIPIWLIVSGCRGLFCIVLLFITLAYCNIMDHCFNKKSLSPVYVLIGCSLVIIILFFFNFAWSIVGIIWSWSNKSTVQYQDPLQPTTYCHSVPYTFQTTMSLFHLIAISMFLIIGCAYARLRTPKPSDRLNEQASNKVFNQYSVIVLFFVIFIIFLT